MLLQDTYRKIWILKTHTRAHLKQTKKEGNTELWTIITKKSFEMPKWELAALVWMYNCFYILVLPDFNFIDVW